MRPAWESGAGLAGQQQPGQADAGCGAAHWPPPGSGRQTTVAADERADERVRAARSVQCPCQAARGVPCGSSGDHLARYLRAEQSGALSRDSLREVIAGLDVIAAHVVIQPPGERTARAAAARSCARAARELEAGA